MPDKYGCCFCDYTHESFEEVARHQVNAHPRDCKANHMYYPIIVKEEKIK